MFKPLLASLTPALFFATPASALFSASTIDTTVINEDMSSTASAFDESEFSEAGNPDGNFFSEFNYFPTDGNPGDYLQIIHFYDPVDDPSISPDEYDTITFYDYNLFSWDPSTDGDIIDISYSLDIKNDGSDIELFFIVTSGTSTRAGGFQLIDPTDGFQTFTGDDLFFGEDLSSEGPLKFGFAIQSFVEDNRDDPGSPYDGDQFAVNVDNFIVTVTTVPEPSSLALLGLGALCVTRWRR